MPIDRVKLADLFIELIDKNPNLPKPKNICISEKTDIKKALGWKELDLLEYLYSIQEALNIELPNEFLLVRNFREIREQVEAALPEQVA